MEPRPLLWLASILLISGVFTSAVTQQVVAFDTELMPLPDVVAVVPMVSALSRWNGVRFRLGPIPFTHPPTANHQTLTCPLYRKQRSAGHEANYP